MTDHHDFGDHHDDYSGGEQHHDEPLNFDDDQQHFDDPGHYGDEQHDDAWLPDHAETHDALPAVEHHETTPTTDDVHIVDDHADTVTAHDGYDDPTDVFPPTVDVGDLPEPVDGFPWIDTAALGTPDLAAHDGETQPVDPHELAEYAGTEIPPGADPWTVLADSDDPATSTLARFWHEAGE
jgi:hypothetical protein